MITPSFGLTATERVLPRFTLDWTTGSPQSGVDVDRAGVATYVDLNGVLQDASADTQRINYSTGIAGLLVEEARTNGLPNNTMQGAVVGTPGTIPTNWSLIPQGLTQEIVAVDTVNGVQYIDIKLSGTTTATNPNILFVGTTTVAALIGQTWTSSFYLAVVGGSLTNITAVLHVISERSAVGTLVANKNGTNIGATGVLTRSSFSTTLTGVTTAFIYSAVRLSITSGVAVDVTLRIGLPQLEQGEFATSVIKTSTVAVTRNADVATITGTNFSDWYIAGAGGVVVRVLPSTVSGTRPALQFDDATADEVIALRGNTTNPELLIVNGGSPQAQIDAGTISANTAYNLGAAWNTDNCAAAVNGGAAVTDTSATIPTVTQALLGSDGTNYLNGNIQTLRYWPQRIINAEVQAFSK
jgi:hypothetical protein